MKHLIFILFIFTSCVKPKESNTMSYYSVGKYENLEIICVYEGNKYDEYDEYYWVITKDKYGNNTHQILNGDQIHSLRNLAK